MKDALPEHWFHILLSLADHLTNGWTRRRVLIGVLLFAVGALLGAPGAETLGAWMLTAALSGGSLVGAYVWLLRYDVSLTPFVVATLVAASSVHDAFEHALPDVAAGAILAIGLVSVAAWWLCGLLRRARSAGPPHVGLA